VESPKSSRALKGTWTPVQQKDAACGASVLRGSNNAESSTVLVRAEILLVVGSDADRTLALRQLPKRFHGSQEQQRGERTQRS
jgi:hypothetical protein